MACQWLLSCEKDQPFANEPYEWVPCKSGQIAPFEIKRVYEYPTYYYAAPDPNRASHFATTGLYEEFGEASIRIFDTQNHTHYTLRNTGLGASEIDWGENGWILFIGEDFQVHKVNPIDSTVVQLTNGPMCFYPAWNPDATRFVYMEYGDKYTLVIADENGNEINRLDSINSWARWSRDGTKILAGDHNWPPQKLFWIDANGDPERHYIFDAGEDWNLYSFDWLPSGDEIVVSGNKLFDEYKFGKVNIHTGEFTPLQTPCITEWHPTLASSRNNGWIYFTQHGQYYNDADSSLVNYSRIAKMDPSGGQIQQVSW